MKLAKRVVYSIYRAHDVLAGRTHHRSALEDIQKLLHVLDRLVETWNTVVVIEHNLDVVRMQTGYRLGPEGGDNGGEVVAVGTPKRLHRMLSRPRDSFEEGTVSSPAYSFQ